MVIVSITRFDEQPRHLRQKCGTTSQATLRNVSPYFEKLIKVHPIPFRMYTVSRLVRYQSGILRSQKWQQFTRIDQYPRHLRQKSGSVTFLEFVFKLRPLVRVPIFAKSMYARHGVVFYCCPYSNKSVRQETTTHKEGQWWQHLMLGCGGIT